MKLLNKIKGNFVLLLGSLLLISLIIIAFFGQFHPAIDKSLSTITYIMDENRKPVIPPYPPSEEFPFGTDKKGRDMLSLIVLGAKETLATVILITLLRYFVALPFSYLAHKRVLGSHFLLNWINGLFSYIPTIVVVILLVSLPPLLTTEIRPLYLLLIVALVEVGRSADMIKLEFDELSSKEFIMGGVASGASSFTLFKSYYLPFMYDKLIVYMITDLGRVMFLLGQLGFVGIFISQNLIQTPTGGWDFVNTSITWPAMLMNSFQDIRGPIWIPFFSALAMTLSIFVFNLFAQGLKKLFNKKVRYI